MKAEQDSFAVGFMLERYWFDFHLHILALSNLKMLSVGVACDYTNSIFLVSDLTHELNMFFHNCMQHNMLLLQIF